jgi:hypothetical protein
VSADVVDFAALARIAASFMSELIPALARSKKFGIFFAALRRRETMRNNHAGAMSLFADAVELDDSVIQKASARSTVSEVKPKL